MAGPAPKEDRRRRNEPARGDWQASEGIGWQHGDIPNPPTHLTAASRDTWRVWMTAWFAAHWGPEDLPVLRQIIRLYDTVERGQANTGDRAELRQLLDGYGITKKGQQDRRWSQPKDDERPIAAPKATERYAHLKVV